MYSFAPASYALQHHHTTAQSAPYRSDDGLAAKLAALTRLADQATRASRRMLTIMVNLGALSGVLRYFPIRCWVLIVSANLHLLKVSILTPFLCPPCRSHLLVSSLGILPTLPVFSFYLTLLPPPSPSIRESSD